MESQEVKEGKIKEFGILPKDWDLKMLKDLASLIIDGTHYTPQYKTYGVPFLRVTDLQSNQIDIKNLRFISKQEHDFLKQRCKPEKGDLLLSKNGTVGVPKAIDWDWEFSIFVSLALIKLRHNKINLYFLEQFIKSHFLDEQIKQRSKQGTVTNLHLEEIREFLIPVPPLPEQEKIAQVLSDFDSAIAHLDQLISKKRNLKQGTMQKLLTGKKRLPGFSGEWKERPLGNLIEKIVGGGTPRRDEDNYWNGDIYWATVKDITSFCPYKTEETITKQGLDSSASNLIPKGTLIISTRMAVGQAVIYEVDVAINQDLKAISFKSDVNPKFILYCFNYYYLTIQSWESGSTVKGINLKDLKKINFPYFDLTEQKAIAQVLSDMDAEIEALEKKRDKYQAMKQGMMQELLTGKTRLK